MEIIYFLLLDVWKFIQWFFDSQMRAALMALVGAIVSATVAYRIHIDQANTKQNELEEIDNEKDNVAFSYYSPLIFSQLITLNLVFEKVSSKLKQLLASSEARSSPTQFTNKSQFDKLISEIEQELLALFPKDASDRLIRQDNAQFFVRLPLYAIDNLTFMEMRQTAIMTASRNAINEYRKFINDYQVENFSQAQISELKRKLSNSIMPILDVIEAMSVFSGSALVAIFNSPFNKIDESRKEVYNINVKDILKNMKDTINSFNHKPEVDPQPSSGQENPAELQRSLMSPTEGINRVKRWFGNGRADEPPELALDESDIEEDIDYFTSEEYVREKDAQAEEALKKLRELK